MTVLLYMLLPTIVEYTVPGKKAITTSINVTLAAQGSKFRVDNTGTYVIITYSNDILSAKNSE